jgi:hypothetical protein
VLAPRNAVTQSLTRTLPYCTMPYSAWRLALAVGLLWGACHSGGDGGMGESNAFHTTGSTLLYSVILSLSVRGCWSLYQCGRYGFQLVFLFLPLFWCFLCSFSCLVSFNKPQAQPHITHTHIYNVCCSRKDCKVD